jgi:hypothetical protein
MILTIKEAAESLLEGKVIGILGINGIEIFAHEGSYIFRHRDGEMEPLNPSTMSSTDGYYVIRDAEPINIVYNLQTRRYEFTRNN